jgi:hypothetical protein
MGYLIVVAIIVFAISAIVARKFEKIANMKGHQGYFWWCFWLGIAGWAMVIALPDRSVKTANGNASALAKDELPDL